MSSFSLAAKHLGLSNDYMSFGSFLFFSFFFFLQPSVMTTAFLLLPSLTISFPHPMMNNL